MTWFCALGNSTTQLCAPYDDMFAMAGCKGGAADCMLLTTATNTQGAVLGRNSQLLTTLANLTLPAATVKAAVSGCSIQVTTDNTAVLVTLTTRAAGRFSDNFFTLPAAQSRTIVFIPFDGTTCSSDLLRTSLRVEHVAMYLA